MAYHVLLRQPSGVWRLNPFLMCRVHGPTQITLWREMKTWCLCPGGGRWGIVAGGGGKGNLRKSVSAALVRWRGERHLVRKMALHVFFPVAASSALSVGPAHSSPCLATGAPKGWRLVNCWSISADFPTLKNNCNGSMGTAFLEYLLRMLLPKFIHKSPG